MSRLHVDSIIKSFNNKQVLTNIYISCKKGEIIGLLGRNGSGKSTLLKIIFGALPATSKFVKIGDTIINGLSDGHSLINYLPQNSFLPNHIKIKTVIELFCNKENAHLISANKLIKPMLNKKSKQLSGGEKRLLEIFLIVHSNSVYTLIDEPFNGIAPIHIESIKEMIKKQSKHKGFIITDHDYRDILDISTRIVVMHDGGTKEIKNKDELTYWGYIPETSR